MRVPECQGTIYIVINQLGPLTRLTPSGGVEQLPASGSAWLAETLLS